MSNPTIDKETETSGTIKCSNCAASLKFKPGTKHLACEYCGTENEIAGGPAEIKENDYHSFLSQKSGSSEKKDLTVCKCSNCGASTTLPANVTGSSCPYCDTPLVVANASTCSIIQPKYLLPFKVENKAAKESFVKWAKGLWFAPSKLKDYAAHSAEKLRGVYMPYWTYDSDTTTHYTGERGEYYYTTETYTDSEGKLKTRRERHTRWYPASGTVYNKFDDILICASSSLPNKLTHSLEPWDLKEMVDFNDQYLKGFLTESYQVDLEKGFEQAKGIMLDTIENSVKSDIGGDTQIVGHLDANYDNITFKHILLPLWISAYSFNNKTYRFVINARTGEVQGERPYSVAKILLLILSIIAIIAAILYFSKGGNE
ncbi:MAG: hypothetical protein AB7O73_13100 [Bacteroidia bacterium]